MGEGKTRDKIDRMFNWLTGAKPASVLPTTTSKQNKNASIPGRNSGNVVLNVAPANGSGAVTVGGLKAAQLQATPHPSLPSTVTQGGGRRSLKVRKAKVKKTRKAKKRSNRK